MKDENFKQKIKNKVGRPKKKNFLSIIKENKMEDENFKKNKVNRNKKSFSLSKIDESFLVKIIDQKRQLHYQKLIIIS